MDESHGGRVRGKAAEELILRTIAAHADSLLRAARRHSICTDDAQDAYQRAVEIFMGHAHRLDPVRAPGWLHVVVKREAQALRRARQELLSTTEPNLDFHQASALPTPEEQLLRFDRVSRSAEALKRLKPHELRALWLRAQGHSYSDIGAITGWSYTKVNRCLTEGRRSFLERYEGIESGAECERWLPVLSAVADGEASADQLVDLRPHLRNCPACRATLRSLRDSSKPLAALFPVPLAIAEPHAGDQLVNLVVRAYEAVAGGVHERAIHSAAKAQMLLEASASGKVAAVAASAAAVAGGGYATVERSVDRAPAASRAAAAATPRHSAAAAKPSWTPPRVTAAASKAPQATATPAARAKARRLATRPDFRPSSQASTKRGRQSTFVAQTLAAGTLSRSATATATSAARFAPRGTSATFAP
jgi:RNA polymerase sigma factor (sigma-70 family)